MKCGLAKSILSPKGLGVEFAKLTLIKVKGKIHNVSPISLKEYAYAKWDICSLASFAKRHDLTVHQALKVGGLG